MIFLVQGMTARLYFFQQAPAALGRFLYQGCQAFTKTTFLISWTDSSLTFPNLPSTYLWPCAWVLASGKWVKVTCMTVEPRFLHVLAPTFVSFFVCSLLSFFCPICSMRWLGLCWSHKIKLPHQTLYVRENYISIVLIHRDLWFHLSS